MLIAYTHLATALPVVTSIEDSASYQLAVAPFMPQLYGLPQKLWANAADPVGLLTVYAETNPVVSGFALALAIGSVVLVVSEINRNWSQIDRLWSILPIVYLGHLIGWAELTGLRHERLDLMAMAILAWSCRLTFNYWRRGGYNIGSEDYRWAVVRKSVPGWVFFLLNATFISYIQSILLFLIALPPAYSMLLANQYEGGATSSDWTHFGVVVALVFVEFIADGQQWSYQTAKHRYQKDGKVGRGYNKADLDRGFVTSGLWAYSRHPNFAAEQAIWFVLYQWSCVASNVLYSWTGAGACFLVLLFQSSTLLTELITGSKYPEYRTYQQVVGRFFPSSLTPYTGRRAVPRQTSMRNR